MFEEYQITLFNSEYNLRLETWAVKKNKPVPFTCDEYQIHFTFEEYQITLFDSGDILRFNLPRT